MVVEAERMFEECVEVSDGGPVVCVGSMGVVRRLASMAHLPLAVLTLVNCDSMRRAEMWRGA